MDAAAMLLWLNRTYAWCRDQPAIDEERCEELLARGQALGYPRLSEECLRLKFAAELADA